MKDFKGIEVVDVRGLLLSLRKITDRGRSNKAKQLVIIIQNVTITLETFLELQNFEKMIKG